MARRVMFLVHETSRESLKLGPIGRFLAFCDSLFAFHIDAARRAPSSRGLRARRSQRSSRVVAPTSNEAATGNGDDRELLCESARRVTDRMDHWRRGELESLLEARSVVEPAA